MNYVDGRGALFAVALAVGLVIGSCKGPRSESAREQSSPAEDDPIVAVETGPDDGVSVSDSPNQNRELSTAIGAYGAVSCAEGHAADIGLQVLKRGGNAVDAAVAIGFALGVTHPSAGNIGGGGFMMIRTAEGATSAVDYREMAPGKATANMYIDRRGKLTKDSRIGPRSAGIPGVVAGFWLAHQKYGSLEWKSLVEPAIRLARDGWELDKFHADDLSWVVPHIRKYQHKKLLSIPLRDALSATLATFSKDATHTYAIGDLWKQPALSLTLEKIANGGQDVFYRGALARHMVKKVRAMGGVWTRKDLATYRAVERETIVFPYREHQIITMPPPSAGGVVLRQILAAMDTLDVEKLEWDSVERTHLYVEALRRIYADRNQRIGDPDFVDIPMSKLLNVEYMVKRMSDVEPSRATPSLEVASGVPAIRAKESEETTHYSIIDKNGMAVANTYTLNGGFGAKVQIPGTGVTLNNQMDDFTTKVGQPNMYGLVQGRQNAIAPRKRMLSSMTPTIVTTKEGKVRAILGSPGGPTITTTVAQVIMQLLDKGRPLEAAVAAPRVHHQWLPDEVWYEETLSATVMTGLIALGHKLKVRRSIGHANCIEVMPDGRYRAVADVGRDGGKAVAY